MSIGCTLHRRRRVAEAPTPRRLTDRRSGDTVLVTQLTAEMKWQQQPGGCQSIGPLHTDVTLCAAAVFSNIFCYYLFIYSHALMLSQISVRRANFYYQANLSRPPLV